MRKSVDVSIVLALSVMLIFGTASARAATPEQVDAAIKTGVNYLYSLQKNGNWERVQKPNLSPTVWKSYVEGAQWGGLTAMATLALLDAGEKPTDPRIMQAVDFLKQAEIRGNYAEAWRAQVWLCLDYEHSPDIKSAITHDADLLINSVQTTGDAKGMYGYWLKAYNHEVWWDHSNSQLSVLGVWALAETNVIEVPTAYWQMVEQGWMAQQCPDGAWCYLKEGDKDPDRARHSLNMTSAGVATLYITQEYLRGDSGCSGNVDNAAIEAGIKWIIDNYAKEITVTREQQEWHPIKYYGLYGTERVGQASGRKYLGTTDWFKTGSDMLVGNAGAGWGNLPDVCFAMYFLTHGRAPVMLNKLEYSIDMHGDKTKDSNWNQRPADARRLARWTGKMTELEFNWQIVNLKVPVDELHDAPMLYIAGDQDLDFTKEEEAKLKQFCEDGGLIMFNADCNSSRFIKSVQQLGTRLFPSAEFRELPADHPIYTDEQFRRAQWHEKPSVQGLTNGARELMIILPDDPARFWQSGAYGGRESRHDIAADIFQYISGNITLLKKGRTFIVRPTGGGGGKPIKLARLQYSGNWDPEPGGWRRLSAIMHNAGHAELTTEPVKLGDGALKNYQIAHLTGTYSIKLPDAARAEIKQFVDGGGTLIVDSCGGSGAFASSMQDQLKTLFGLKTDLPVLKPDHAVYATGPKLEKAEYRRMTQKVVGQSKTARLRGLEVNGRVAVFFSPEDLSTGLVGVPCDGVYGYMPATACSLMEDVLLYAAADTGPAVEQNTAPASAPSTKP